MEPASHLLYHNSITNRIGRKKRGDKSRKCARLVDYHRFGAGVLIQVGGKRLRTRRPQPPVEVPDIQFEVFMSIIQIRCAGYSEIKSKHLTKICMWAKKYFSRSFFLSFWAISVGVFFGGNNLFHRFGHKSAPPFPAADSTLLVTKSCILYCIAIIRGMLTCGTSYRRTKKTERR